MSEKEQQNLAAEWLLKLISSFDFSDLIAIFALLTSLSTLIFMYSSWRYRNNVDKDEKIVTELNTILERAYGCITDSENIQLNQSRLSWLNAARHLLRYEILENEIKTKVYKLLRDEHEEHWRLQFYLLLKKIPNEYFYTWIDSETNEATKIEYRSAAIVLAFSNPKLWKNDPIDNINFEKVINENYLFSRSFNHYHDFIKHNLPKVYSDINNKT